MKKSPLISKMGNCYIIDTAAARQIACHPHIVSGNLSNLCYEAALEFRKVLDVLDLISPKSGILHILRGSSGYMLDKILPSLPVLNIRTLYIEDGYRAHSDHSRRIDITYSDYNGGEYSTLIVPDTYATGRSVEAALKFLFSNGFHAERLVIYGFMAIPGIERLYTYLDMHGVDLISFAICDITQLSSNNYDMPLYGIDENLYMTNNEVSNLGSIVSLETLRDMVDFYIPGMDQPGDWSERQSFLFNGIDKESGDIIGHLTKSIDFINSLDKFNRNQAWYNDAIKKATQMELKQLRFTLSNLD